MDAIGRMLLAILLLGITGTGAELLLIGHFEDRWQVVPLVLFTLALIAVAWERLAASRASVRLLQVVMALFVVSGAAGMYLHYGGNVEFERELDSRRSGLDLFKEAMSGATPVLAPGTMTLLGLIGLVYSHARPGRGMRTSTGRS